MTLPNNNNSNNDNNNPGYDASVGMEPKEQWLGKW
jgi:hypothetical protein